jgi:hypothetical protein
MGWLIAIVVLVAIAAVYVWASRGGWSSKDIDDAHSHDMTVRGPVPPQDGSQRRL